MSKYRKHKNSCSIDEIKKFIKDNLYRENLDDDNFFWSSLYTHHIATLNNNLSLNGMHHIDATYKIKTYEYPLIVYGVIDAVGKFHPISFRISSQDFNF